MRSLFLFSALLAIAVAGLSRPERSADVTDVQKQEAILRLLYRVYEPIPASFTRLHAASKVNPVGAGNFKDGGEAAVKLNHEIDDHRVEEQHHFFSLFNPRQREEALMLFEVLMSAADFETFASSAAYYRARINEGEFVYALYVAVIHSDLTSQVVLPPLYEVTPHMFTNNEVIQQAYSAKMRQEPGTFKMSFTGTHKNPEQRVAYFGEDIGLNVHHVTWHMEYPFWWKDSYGQHIDRKGELFFWSHHQLTARFDAERLSNNLDVVDELQFDQPIVEGFAPHTSYKYGGEFPSRPDNVHFEDVDGVARIRDLLIMESRIRDAIAHGYVDAADGSKIDIRNDQGIDVLGDIIESSMYSPNPDYYGALHNLAHIVLGRQGDPHGKFGMAPGVMEHFETATRDPAFFRLHKYMNNLFKEHKDSLPPYTAADIDFPDISIDAIRLEGVLETFFEDFEFDLSNAVDSSDNVKDVSITAKVSRLAHSPAKLILDVTNSRSSKVHAIVRGFMCPTYDYNGIELTLDEARWACIDVAKYKTVLEPGKNTLIRSAEEASVTTPDIPSFQTLIEATKNGKTTPHSSACGIPNRLLLPKGKPEGMDFNMVVMVSDFETDAILYGSGINLGSHPLCGVHGGKYPDKKPMGYPFDKRIPDERIFQNAQNIVKIKAKITHRV